MPCREDLEYMRAACVEARNALMRVGECLVGRDSHPFLEDAPSGPRIALALLERNAITAVEALNTEIIIQVDYAMDDGTGWEEFGEGDMVTHKSKEGTYGKVLAVLPQRAVDLGPQGPACAMFQDDAYVRVQWEHLSQVEEVVDYHYSMLEKLPA